MTLHPPIKQATALLATALIFTFVGLISVSQVRDFVAWKGNMVILCGVAFLCGVLLALCTTRPVWLALGASALAFFLFAAIWTYIASVLLEGVYISPGDLLLSDFVFLYVMQRGGMLFVACGFSGLTGAALALVALPDAYQP